jgi:N6-L-threonylcarbamoyladenine synthase
MAIVLGIETSCDDSAVAFVKRKENGEVEVLGHELSSQMMIHTQYGGVVPEIASRNHLDIIGHLYQRLLRTSNIAESEIDAVSVTAGPGLIGGLLVGVMFAKGLAIKLNKPLIGVNHLEGHALVVCLTHKISPPYLLLLVSGGHCQILKILDIGKYELVGKTRDDSIGEAFDKVAKMLGLGYPGGPIIEQYARNGDEHAIPLPVPILHDTPYDFSFSGLKTAVKRYIDKLPLPLSEQDIFDVCASFQRVVGDVLCNRLRNVMQDMQLHQHGYPIVISGGVAANRYLLNRVRDTMGSFYACAEQHIVTPPINLCTDNGIMIAWAGLTRYELGKFDSLKLEPRSRWPLDEGFRTTD